MAESENQKIKQVVVNGGTYDVEDMYAARIASPTFTGTPIAPDYGDSTTSQIATINYVQKYVTTAIAEAITKAIAAAY